MQDNNNYLYHHGVKGQSWGKKNGPPYPLDDSISTGKSLRKKKKPGLISKLRKRAKARAAEKKKKEKETTDTRRSVKDMTDQELRDTVQRLNMEKQYRTLTKKETSKGRKMIADALQEAGKKYLSELIYNTLKNVNDPSRK